MGLVTSRLNFESLHVGGQRSQQDEVFFSYILGKNHFSNYFLMGGERFEVNDKDYLFGDNCDLNFLGCSKPTSIPFKKAQQHLLANLKQDKSCNNNNKASSRSSRFGSPLNILASQPDSSAPADLRCKQDVQQTQTLTTTKGMSEPSRPLVMFVNTRKETIRLVKSSSNTTSSSMESPDIEPTGMNNSVSISTTNNGGYKLIRKPSSRNNRYLALADENADNMPKPARTAKKCEPDIGSLVSAVSSTKSGYTSVKGEDVHVSSERDSELEDDEDDFKDALNVGEDDNRSDKAHHPESLPLNATPRSTRRDGDVRITIDNSAAPRLHSRSSSFGDNLNIKRDKTTKSMNSLDRSCSLAVNHAYNIEFYFDAEVECYIQIFYFCTREITSTGITYKTHHANHKSNVYYYKKGLNQKFHQPEHTFQPYLFDEDLLVYKPLSLDIDGNYNSGSMFPIVIHCVTLEGPRQSNSLVATIEKSQLDGSYSIKPLKQLIFADGVQYILQDIYGIEHKQLFNNSPRLKKSTRRTPKDKSHSLQSNLSETTSVSGLDLGSESTFECVICISEERDTMLLPCRHLCLCLSCAQSLRYQANSCPICRSPFSAALNLRPTQRQAIPVVGNNCANQPLVEQGRS